MIYYGKCWPYAWRRRWTRWVTSVYCYHLSDIFARFQYWIPALFALQVHLLCDFLHLDIQKHLYWHCCWMLPPNWRIQQDIGRRSSSRNMLWYLVDYIGPWILNVPCRSFSVIFNACCGCAMNGGIIFKARPTQYVCTSWVHHKPLRCAFSEKLMQFI